MVRGQEAEDLKHSMAEALTDYKKLLKHEVKKEEKRSLSMPMMAIASPQGKALLPSLTKARANPADLELRALKGRKTTKVSKPYAGLAAGRRDPDSAQQLAKQLMQKADFHGGPWDEQEASEDVKDAKDVAFHLPQHQHHFATPVIPVEAPSAAPVRSQIVTERPPLSQPPVPRSAVPQAPPRSARIVAPAPRPEPARPREPVAAPAGPYRPASKASVDVAGLLIGDVAKDLGF
mmetsp:Transcript_48574/g.75841  ORF Transcript_48574/g.75841 Transcript_48574/m.75841 type:complete len:234 (+) Transcript_48574:229-930(+)